MNKLFGLLGLLLILPGCGGGSGDSGGNSALVAKGKTLYELSCKSCHGAGGHVDDRAKAQFPGIKNLDEHPWKIAVTPEAVREAIVKGIPGTPMPTLDSLSKDDLDALVAYTMTLAPKGAAPAETPKKKVELEKAGFTAVAQAKVAPPLEYVDLKHQPTSLEHLKGSWRVLHFWSKASQGLADLQKLQALASEMKTVKFVVIAGDEHDPDEIISTTQGVINSLPLFAVKNQTGMDRYEIKSLPVTFLIDPEGYLLARKDGQVDEGKLREVLTSMLQ
jgi:cytochrome c5